jgi:hypothetical protein
MVDTFDNSMMDLLSGGNPDSNSAPDINPNTGQPNMIPRNAPDSPQRRRRLVQAWTDKVKKAKRYWKPSFERMREDQEFAFGKQWSKDTSDRRYVANLTLRLVAQKTAFLYAKNPKAVAKKRPRLNATSWDESQTTLNQLMQSGAMMMQQAQMAGMPGGGGTGGGIPPQMMGGVMQAASGAIGGAMPTAGQNTTSIDALMAGGAPSPPMGGAPGGLVGGPPGGSLNAISAAMGSQLGGATMPGMGAGPIPGSMQGGGGLGDQLGMAAAAGAAGGMVPPGSPMMAQAVGSGLDIMMDAARVKNENIMMDKLARTLELLYAYEVDNQPHPFKSMLKMTVRRAVTNGVAYVKLGYERVMALRPDLEKGIADANERLATLERLAADAADDITDDDDKEAEQIRLLLADLAAQAGAVVREGLTFDFPQSTKIIPDIKCIDLKNWVAADWVAEEFLLSTSEIEEIYGVDVRGHCTEYGDNDASDPVSMMANWSTSKDKDEQREDKNALVWEIYSRKDGLVYVICDGYKDFLREPASPDIYNERFYPWYALIFNGLEDEKELFPPSDVRLIRDMQLEYNRCREGLKEQRIAGRPFIGVVAGALDAEDLEKITNREANAVIELNALQPNQDIKQLLQAYAGAGVDPNLYEVNPVYEDILRTTGIQEANLGGTSNTTATQSQIAEGSRMTSMGSNIDDLNDLLTQMARNGGQILLREMSQDRVKKVVGPGAVWPAEPEAQNIANEILLEIEAGSMGRPNQAQEIANAQRLYPLLIQLPGIDPEFLAKDVLRRLDDRLDLTEAFKSALPSIVAMNGAMSGAGGAAGPTMPGAGAGAGAAMGAQGPMNAPEPGGPAPGGAPDAGQTLEGMKPGRPHPMPNQVKMPTMPG